jgi:predicted aspartyl protease
METEMGRVFATATIENLGDLVEVDRRNRSDDQVRRIVVNDALVDTGATALALPTRLIGQLGLKKVFERRARSTRGTHMVAMYQAVRLTIEGRSCTVDVMEVPDDVPALIGQVPLELLDFVVDPQGQRLIGNPAHQGEHILDLY